MSTKSVLAALAAVSAAFVVSQLSMPSTQSPQAAAKSPRHQLSALESLRAYLSLSDAQARQLQGLSDLNRSETRATSERLRSHQARIHEMVNSGEYEDATRFDPLVEELSVLRGQLETSRQELARKAVAILTPGQQQKLAALSSAVQAERRASPQAMPKAWPLIYAASQLGLIAPATRGDSIDEGNEMGVPSAPGTIAAAVN